MKVLCLRSVVAAGVIVGGMGARGFISQAMAGAEEPGATMPTTGAVNGAATQAVENPLARAQALVVVDCPASSNMEYPDYPPYGAEWDRMAAEAHEKNAGAREIVHEMRGLSRIDLPPFGQPGAISLNIPRNLANHVGDEALYLHLHGDDAGALESIRDLYHLADFFRGKQQSADGMVRMLVGAGIDTLASARLMVVTSGLRLRAAEGTRPVGEKNVRAMIAELLDYRSMKEQLGDGLQSEPSLWTAPVNTILSGWSTIVPSYVQFSEVLERINSERVFAAMSLACHLYRHDKGHWPGKLDDLVPAYLPHTTIDPWGDGKETFGYVLVKGGLPDGSDRRLVYDRAQATGPLFYRIDAPQYVRSFGDGSDRPLAQQAWGGQFRDVARWVPKAGEKHGKVIEYLH